MARGGPPGGGGASGGARETERQVEDRFSQFLLEFQTKSVHSALKSKKRSRVEDDDDDNDDENGSLKALKRKYFERLQLMVKVEATTLPVDFGDILEFDAELATAIELEYARFEINLRAGAKSALLEVRRQIIQSEHNGELEDYEEEHAWSTSEVFVALHSVPFPAQQIRNLKSESVGRLTVLKGTVTRSTESRPELLLATFTCLRCNLEVSAIEQQLRYSVPQVCKNPQCNNSSRIQWNLDLEKSIFCDWQRIRVQESPDEIPAGSLPRSFDLVVRDEMVEQVKAGDKIIATGVLCAVPDTGGLARAGETPLVIDAQDSTAQQQNNAKPKGGAGAQGFSQGVSGTKIMGCRELAYKLVFLAASVEAVTAKSGGKNWEDAPWKHGLLPRLGDQEQKAQAETYDAEGNLVYNVDEFEDGDIDAIPQVSDEAREASREEHHIVRRVRATPRVYDQLAASIAPTIYGHQDIKQGVLLQLAGGVHKRTNEGIKLRGDINVCVVGDPSTAKSQFLKYVHGFSPRAVYTSGKAASAAGLTASVVRDPDTGDFCVEAGALMLADNGVCCIDEFDKMEGKDQVAIHEAMEQQTISITKAGIQANLNARTSILAAANPKHGRYDRTKTLKANVDMTAPIMSRFDLFFVVVDDCDEFIDRSVATHIVDTHRGLATALDAPFTRDELQVYIKHAKRVSPRITDAAKRRLVARYRTLRQNDSVGRSKSAYRITVRQLESLIRLAEAHARLHLCSEVQPENVDEAFRLLKKSIISVETEAVVLDDIEEEEEPDFLPLPEIVSAAVPEAEHADQAPEQEQNMQTQDDDDDDDQPLESALGLTDKQKKKKQKTKEKVKLSYEDYQRYSAVLTGHLRKQEKQNVPGLSRSALISWYLEAHRDIIGDDEDKIRDHSKLLKQIVKRLLKDESLIVIPTDTDQILLAVHPNYAPAGTLDLDLL